jgi:hypothetical protein
MSDQNLVNAGREALAQCWSEVAALAESGQMRDVLGDEELVAAIRRSVNSPTKTYRYVLPAQVLAKLVDPSLDSRCIQVSRGGVGAFDARSFAHEVIVPFDRANHNVLGGSEEPYVSKPLREPEVTDAYRRSKKNKSGWDDLSRVLQIVQERDDTDFTNRVLRQVLTEIHARLGGVHVVYPVPRRISLARALELLDAFFVERSGGDRFQAVTTALFLTLGRQFGIFTSVRRERVNSADTASGRIADIECVTDAGDIVFVVEAKDRELSITQLQDKIPGLRKHQVAEAFFVAAKGIAAPDEAAIKEIIDREFVSGQNVYITEFQPLARVVLALIGEAGRRRFLEQVGHQLDEFSDIQHRRAWATLLRGV